MPFTPTHSLAAVPIAWFWTGAGIFPALVIGSMVPDWPLYVPYGPHYNTTHSLPGIFIACLPLGLAIAIFFQLVLKRALFELMPVLFQSRLVRYMEPVPVLSLRQVLAIGAAVTVGAATHIGWDAFTHRGQWGVALFPILNQPVALTVEFSLPVYSLLQHGSTMIGFPIFLLLTGAWFRLSDALPVPRAMLTRPARTGWILLFTLMPLGLMIRMLIDLTTAESARDIFRTLFTGVTRSGLAILIVLLCYGLFFAGVSWRRSGRRVAAQD